MTTYECVDERAIEATTAECYASLTDELAGRSAWWMPFVVMTPKDDLTPQEEGSGSLRGAIVERWASPQGTTDRFWSTARMSMRVAGIEPDRRVVLNEEGGDFRGSEEWTFDALDDGRTLVKVHWVAEPHGYMRLLAPFGRIAADHSLIIREGLRGMEHYVKERRRFGTGDLGDEATDRPRG